MIYIYIKRCFSLPELIVVIAIIALISGITVSQVGRLPSSTSLKNNALQVKALFIAGGLRAIENGLPQTITYSITNHTFTLNEISLTSEVMPQKRQHKTIEFSLTNGTQAIFDTKNDSNVALSESADQHTPTFTCFPDGLIAGPNIELTLHKYKLKLQISPLTGAITIIKPNNNGEYEF